MAKDTTISWCHHTHNHWIGCTEDGPECKNCYAREMAQRFGWAKWGAGEPRRFVSDSARRQPLVWNRAAMKVGERRRVFANSLSDIGDPEVPFDWFVDFMELVGQTPYLDWMLLTKRPGELKRRLEAPESRTAYLHGRRDTGQPDLTSWRLPNVWVGTTAGDQKRADRRIPKLLAINAVCHFVSCEPLIGPIDLHGLLPAVKLVICGGESGKAARPMHPDWARGLRDQCAAAGAAFHFKQWGEWKPAPEIIEASGPSFHQWPDGTYSQWYGTKQAGRILDGREHLDIPRIPQ